MCIRKIFTSNKKENDDILILKGIYRWSPSSIVRRRIKNTIKNIKKNEKKSTKYEYRIYRYQYNG